MSKRCRLPSRLRGLRSRQSAQYSGLDIGSSGIDALSSRAERSRPSWQRMSHRQTVLCPGRIIRWPQDTLTPLQPNIPRQPRSTNIAGRPPSSWRSGNGVGIFTWWPLKQPYVASGSVTQGALLDCVRSETLVLQAICDHVALMFAGCCCRRRRTRLAAHGALPWTQRLKWSRAQ